MASMIAAYGSGAKSRLPFFARRREVAREVRLHGGRDGARRRIGWLCHRATASIRGGLTNGEMAALVGEAKSGMTVLASIIAGSEYSDNADS